MTVSSSTNRVSYNGNGATTAFSFPYLFYATGDLTVTLVASDGTETTQTETTHYTVTGAGDPAGGTVTMVTAPATGQKLVIVREVDYTQELDLVENDPLPADSLEERLDLQVMMAQQLKEVTDRSIKFPKADSTSLSATLPSAANRANKALVFDASGNVSVGSDDYEDQAAAAAASAANAATSATNAASSASAAATSATNASNSATAAATSATNASNSATAAATSETNAATSATNAASSATAAQTAETNAETAETNAETAQAAAEAAAAAVFWNFDDATAMADPGTGDLRLDNAALASVANIAVSASVASTGNPDVSDWIVTWDDSTNTNKGTLTIRKAGAPGTFATFTVTGVTDNTTWLQIAVTHVASSGSLSSGDDLYVSFSRAGDKGVDGTGTGTVTTAGAGLELSGGGTTLGIADGGVGTTQLADDAVTLAKLADGAVGTTQLVDDAVTLAKLAAGTSGQVIGYDADGNPAAMLRSYPDNKGYVAARYYGGGQDVGANNTLVVTADRLYGRPLLIGRPITISHLGIEVITGAGTYARLGLYQYADGVPGALIVDAGNVTVSSTGLKEAAISQALAPGVYWVACVFDGTPTVRAGAVSHHMMQDICGHQGVGGATGSYYFGGYVAHTFGALPDPFGTVTWVNAAAGGGIPTVWIRGE